MMRIFSLRVPVVFVVIICSIFFYTLVINSSDKRQEQKQEIFFFSQRLKIICYLREHLLCLLCRICFQVYLIFIVYICLYTTMIEDTLAWCSSKTNSRVGTWYRPSN